MDKKSTPVHNEHYSNFVFLDYSIEKIELSSNPKFVYDKPVEIKFSFEKDISIRSHVSDRQDEEKSEGRIEKEATITVKCLIFENPEENNYPFTLNIKISGEFKYIGIIEDDEFKQFCEMNGIATLLPYLRASITNITALANIQPLVLPLINVYNLNNKVN